jgi:hypothetical protein
MDVEHVDLRAPAASVCRHHRECGRKRLVVVDREQDLAVHADHLAELKIGEDRPFRKGRKSRIEQPSGPLRTC